MKDIVQIFNSKMTCPKCGESYSVTANLWRRTVIQKGDGTVLIAALCCNCTKQGLTREKVLRNSTVLEADSAGRIVRSYFNMT